MATARKRPRPEESTENVTECPFTVIHADPNEKEMKTKRRRGGSEDRPAPPPKIHLQVSPFSPIGKFNAKDNTMDRHYQIAPFAKWMDMTRYNSFVLNGVKYHSEGFVFVANDNTIERQKNPGESRQPRKKSDDDWVARILEIRAADEHHVYARVYWMYWPDELPAGTTEGKRVIKGRQPYHGNNELIASNHMDVINVVSVTASAIVHQWDETNEDEVQPALYWRQAFDVRTMDLSSAEERCRCNRPENPDKKLIGCTNEECRKWLHDECLIHEALLRTFARLGTNKPHKLAPVKDERDNETDRQPLSPSESGAPPTAELCIDVKPEEQVTVKMADVGNVLPIITAERTGQAPEPKKRGRGRKSDAQEAKPYEGYFSAIIRSDASPPVVEITDLREEVTGGLKEWTEPLDCLVCGQQIR
ncbi:BAH domain-containing protein [Microdochium trichocladiopsis]|uniref:BAH domain-containing protein n=1 Tax=Microdochium trichocladiopsis TaxID=1682393 RepID=A0A9P9BM41_9PEZI|nr:BAH domain-containing protein [Microdochium trichocladiopsis]KAH7016045.1 BAH domain-containing protein [Microdochium trichocladiopsis]